MEHKTFSQSIASEL